MLPAAGILLTLFSCCAAVQAGSPAESSASSSIRLRSASVTPSTAAFVWEEAGPALIKFEEPVSSELRNAAERLEVRLVDPLGSETVRGGYEMQQELLDESELLEWTDGGTGSSSVVFYA